LKDSVKAKAESIYRNYIAEQTDKEKDNKGMTLYLSPRAVQLAVKQLQAETLESTLFDAAAQEAEHTVLRPQFAQFLKARQ